MTIGEELKKIGLKVAYKYLDRDPETNMPKLMDWLDKYIGEDILVKQRSIFRDIINTRENNWYKLLYSLWDDIDDDIRKSIFENMVINANAIATVKARQSKESYRCNIPWAIVIDITIPEQGDYLSFDQIDDIVEQAKELGTFMFVFTGESNENRKEEIIALCNKHKDCQFMCFGRCLGIDDDFAEQMRRVKNIIPALRLYGDETDVEAEQVMDILHEKKLPYGCYCFYDEGDMERYAKESFFDNIIDHHGKFCFFLSSVDEGRDLAYDAVLEYRSTKPLLAINFCKDKDITGGCAAGGRYYCAIKPNGDVVPCIFSDYSDSNINEGTLLESYKTPVFLRYRDEEPVCEANIKIRGER